MAELKLVVMDLPSIKYEYVYEGFKELTDSKDCEVIILPPGTPRETMIKEASEADGIVFCYELVDEAFLDQMKKPKILTLQAGSKRPLASNIRTVITRSTR